MNEIEPGIWDHLLIFLLGIVLPSFAVFQSQPEMKSLEFDTVMKKQVYYGNSFFQWICAIAVMIVWWSYGRSLVEMGFCVPEWSRMGIILIFLFSFLYGMDVWWEMRNPDKIAETKAKWLKDVPFLPVNWLELKHFLFVALTAGVCEEIIFRGFFIQYFLAINTDNLLGNCLSVIIPAFLFAFGHLYQGGKAVVKTMLMAILFGWIFLVTKSLWPLIILHFLVDVIGGYLAMKILSDIPET